MSEGPNHRPPLPSEYHDGRRTFVHGPPANNESPFSTNSTSSYASKDSGYSSIGSASAGSMPPGDAHHRKMRPYRTADYRTAASYAQPTGVHRIRDREQPHVEAMCQDPHCDDPDCVQTREALYQYRHPQMRFPPLPAPSSGFIRPPNPFMPLPNLATGPRDHGRQDPFRYTQPPAPSLQHYEDPYSVHATYRASLHSARNHDNVAYYDTYLENSAMPERIPSIPTRAGPYYMHDYPGDLSGMHNGVQLSYSHLGPEQYQQQWEHGFWRDRPQFLMPPPPAPKLRRASQHESKRSRHKNDDMLTEQTEAKPRKSSRAHTSKHNTVHPSKALLTGGRDDKKHMENSGHVTTPEPDDDRAGLIHGAGAAADLNKSPDTSDTPQMDTDLAAPGLEIGQSTATDDAADSVQIGHKQRTIPDTDERTHELTEDLPSPYATEAEIESDERQPVPQPIAVLSEDIREADVEDSECPKVQAAYCAVSPLTSRSHTAERSPPRPSTPEHSTSQATSQQEQQIPGQPADSHDEFNSASLDKSSTLDLVEKLMKEAQQKGSDQQQRQTSVVMRFSEALIGRCRPTADLAMTASTGLQTSAVVLLQTYSHILLASAETSDEIFAARSVSEHGSAISRRMTEAFSSPTLHEKLNLLWKPNKISGREEEPLLPSESDFEKDCTYLIEHLAFTWLVNRIRVAMSTSNDTAAINTTRAALLQCIGSNNCFSLRLDWDLRDFFEDQYEDAEHVELGSVICICGTISSAQALSVEEYLDMVWPDLGPQVLESISAALKSFAGKHKVRLPDGDSFSVVLRDGVSLVEITASPIVALEVCEIVTWLATACRASPSPHSISICKPSIVPDTASKLPSCSIQFNIEDGEPKLIQQGNKCWRQLFQNPVVADGYPTRAREPGDEGLQLSLQMMLLLGQAPSITSYQGITMLKGFNSLFVPMACPGSSILWHFLLNQDETRLPYNLGLEQISEPYALDDATLQSRRHFVGWTQAADVVAGSSHATYDIEQSDTDISRPAFATLSAVNITVSKIVGVGMTLNRGKKDIPPALTGRGVYERQIASTGDWHVIMHDTLDRRAWLLDGASALVHISIAGLHSCDKLGKLVAEANDEIEDDFKPKTDQLKYPQGCEGRSSALNVLLKLNNRGIQIFPDIKQEEKSARNSETGVYEKRVEQVTTWWRWQDLVTEKFAILEMLHDQSVRRRNCPSTDIRLPFGAHSIEGFEFDDIVQGSSPLQPRVTKVESSYGGWLNFSNEIDAITLSASGFGELVMPAEAFSGGTSRAKCGQRASCPVGYDYLIAPLSVLEQIHKKGRTRRNQTDNSVRLGDTSFWHDTLVPLEHCECARRRCGIRTAKLQSSSSRSRQSAVGAPSDEVFKRFARGAVIFGSGETHSTASMRTVTPELPRRVSSTQSTSAKARDSGIDMGESSSSNVSAVSPRNSSSPDSGIGSESPSRPERVPTSSSAVGSSRTGASQHGGSRSDTHSQRRESAHSSRTSSSGVTFSQWLMRNTHTPSKNRRSSNEVRSTTSQRTESTRSSGTGQRRERKSSPSRSTRRQGGEEPTLPRRERR